MKNGFVKDKDVKEVGEECIAKVKNQDNVKED